MVKCGGMSSLEQVSLGPASVGLGWKSRSKKESFSVRQALSRPSQPSVRQALSRPSQPSMTEGKRESKT